MSEFMIHRKILRQCGGDLEHSVESRTTGKSSAEDIINILEEVTTRTRIGSSRVNIRTRQITVSKVSPVNLELEKFKSENSNEAEINFNLTETQESELSSLLYDHKEAFKSDKEPLEAIVGYEADNIANIERPYPPILRRPAYPVSPRSTEALEINIKVLLDLGIIRKAGHNEEVEITTSVIVAWHNGKSRMVGDFRALNTYTVPDRYPYQQSKFPLSKYLKKCI
ncbi:hypothetical protein O181_040304 [Austropuccinia psidii MF-1]|uniref:Uncharacterized protein n=1 Tax=Austropuccinia psidii MF-1 TaxID=1389203 RepID=A0A9Q3HFD7_9BASI|nr:hypothetical protein [Austropuccinia psidii MF-1]